MRAKIAKPTSRDTEQDKEDNARPPGGDIIERQILRGI